uniref:Putative secreted protein n=1 Tax=Ixodes ricinus TaxID=34613 RepID=A0A6B0U8A9_IXORI
MAFQLFSVASWVLLTTLRSVAILFCRICSRWRASWRYWDSWYSSCVLMAEPPPGATTAVDGLALASLPSGRKSRSVATMHPCVTFLEFSTTSTPNCTMSPEQTS